MKNPIIDINFRMRCLMHKHLVFCGFPVCTVNSILQSNVSVSFFVACTFDIMSQKATPNPLLDALSLGLFLRVL